MAKHTERRQLAREVSALH